MLFGGQCLVGYGGVEGGREIGPLVVVLVVVMPMSVPMSMRVTVPVPVTHVGLPSYAFFAFALSV